MDIAHGSSRMNTDYCELLRSRSSGMIYFINTNLNENLNRSTHRKLACNRPDGEHKQSACKKQFKFSLNSVDNFVAFACCTRGVTLSKLMLHSFAGALTRKK